MGMKKMKLLIPVICLYFAGFSVARAQQFEPGDITVSAGYGFPSLTKTFLNLVEGDNISTSLVGPVFIKAEFALNETVGFGVNTAFTFGEALYERTDDNTDSVTYTTGIKYNAYSVLARFNFHFGNNAMFDPYAGIGMGYRNSKYTYTGNDPDVDPREVNGIINFGVDLTIGARLYLTDNIGLYGEVGLSKAPFQIGLVAKF
jgi:opacity protein-like surface antigen